MMPTPPFVKEIDGNWMSAPLAARYPEFTVDAESVAPEPAGLAVTHMTPAAAELLVASPTFIAPQMAPVPGSYAAVVIRSVLVEIGPSGRGFGCGYWRGFPVATSCPSMTCS